MSNKPATTEAGGVRLRDMRTRQRTAASSRRRQSCGKVAESHSRMLSFRQILIGGSMKLIGAILACSQLCRNFAAVGCSLLSAAGSAYPANERLQLPWL